MAQKDLKSFRQEAQDIRRSAQKAVQRSGDTFREMALLLDKTRSEVEQQIWSHQENQLCKIQELEDQPKQIQKTNPVVIQTAQQHYFEEATTAVSALREKLQLTLEEGLANVSLSLNPLPVFPPSPDEPCTREGFLQYSLEITLDPNTISNYLSLSNGNRRVTVVGDEQKYPDHPDRFTYWDQVLSRESLTGRCYWEVEWSGCWMRIAVSYRDIQREGNVKECGLGFNDISWALEYQYNRYSFRFNSVQSQVSGPVSSRIGVYLDHSAGILSFYSVSETMNLLHRVQTTFTQPLYAGFWTSWKPGDTAHFLKLK